MKAINIHEAKTHFSKLINEALQGEDIVIAKGGKPLIRLTPYIEELSPRKGGQLKGIMQVSDNFDAPLPEELLKQFYKDSE
jgi:prevent-host-death family protein